MKKIVLLAFAFLAFAAAGCSVSKEVPQDREPLPIPDKPPVGMGTGGAEQEPDDPAPSQKLEG